MVTREPALGGEASTECFHRGIGIEGQGLEREKWGLVNRIRDSGQWAVDMVPLLDRDCPRTKDPKLTTLN